MLIDKELDLNTFFNNYSADIALENEIDLICEDDIGRTNKTLTFCEHTPLVFRALGIKDLPIEIYVDKLARGLFKSEEEKHGHSNSINKDLVKMVVKVLGDPIAIFDSATVQNSIVSLYGIEDKKGKLIMLSISLNKEKNNRLVVNLITSIYGKDSKSSYQNWLNQKLLRYVDDKKIKELSVRLQLPSASILYTNKVLTKTLLVNKLKTYLIPNIVSTTELNRKEKHR